MSWWMAVRIALRALRVNKLRSGLTMLGIVIGVGAVITLVAIGAGAQAQIQEQIEGMGSNMIVVVPGATTESGARLGTGSRATLTEDDAYAIAREILSIHAAFPALPGTGQVVAGSSNWATSFGGVTPDFFEVRSWPVAKGRVFDAAEMAGAAKVAVLGATVARHLFGDADPLGQIVRVQNVPLEVIGVLQSKGQNVNGQDQDDLVLMPISTARKRVLGGNIAFARSVASVTIKVRDGAEMGVVEQEVKQLLRQRHRLQPGQLDDFTVQNLAELLGAREESSRTMTWLLTGIAAVSLLVGGIGIMNTMLVSVTERTREIGLRMAVGAYPSDILMQFLVEAVTLALLGGIFGVLAGVVGSHLLADLAEWRVEIPMRAITIAAGFSGAVGVFFGFYPALKASRLLPIDALRYE